MSDDAARPVSLSDLAFHILLALGDGPSHGYAIGKFKKNNPEAGSTRPRARSTRRCAGWPTRS